MRSEEGMTEGEMPDEGMLDVGMTDERIRKPKPRKIRAAVVIGALALGLLGGGGMIAYFTHTNLDLTIQGLETAYTAEQTAAKKLVRRAQELSKTSAQAQARVKAREEKPADDLPGLNYALGMSYSKRGMKEEARNAFQTALKFDPNYAEAHFELARLYLVSFDDNRSATRHFRQYLALKPTAEDAERVKGWLMKTEKELNADKQRQGWGKMGLVGGLRRIFE